MHKVLILGAGKIGALISGLLAESGDYDVTLGDVNSTSAESVGRPIGPPNARPCRASRKTTEARPAASPPATGTGDAVQLRP